MTKRTIAPRTASKSSPASKEGRCRLCRAPVFWVRTVRWKNLPLDPEPSDDYGTGNFVLHGGTAHYITDVQRTEQLDAGNEVWVPHFATCPNGRRGR